MEYRKLGRTGLDVSVICLGTMTWGEQNSEAEGHAQMDYAFEQGVNLLDTAELYAIPPRPETQGSTERIIGSWLRARKNRDRVILASKVVGRSDMTWFRKDGAKSRLTRAQMTEALEGSLTR
ncbi:MAG: aldo/keto reductase, partial [Rhabdaerophilum calidifontis]